MRAIADGLGKDPAYFDSWFESESSAEFRAIHYIPRKNSTVKSNKLSSEDLKLVTPPHADSGFITLLSTFMYPGL